MNTCAVTITKQATVESLVLQGAVLRPAVLDNVVTAVGGKLYILPVHSLHLLSAKLTIDEQALRGIVEGAEGVQTRQHHCRTSTHDDL